MKVWNKRNGDAPPDAVYVGRPSKWGNPFTIGRDGTREEVITKYLHWLPDSGLNPAELEGKNLVCWCAPLPCHADILLKLANPSPE